MIFSAGLVHAGIIATENAKASASFDASDDGTAAGSGVVDVYPASWSIAAGDTLALKVRSTTAWSVSVFRVGWYGGGGATLVASATGKAADPQPYPTADLKYGLAAAGWHDSVTFPTAGFVSGLYMARVDQTGGKQALTFFVVRDDGAVRQPILFLIATNTHEAYNAWPGPDRGGKSIYGFNSSPPKVTDTIGMNQAVKVSFDRPMYVGYGTADVTRWEYPAIRFLEKKGWDVGYATDNDIHRDPSLVMGRKVVIIAGHSEYWSRPAYDAMIAARDSGVNILSISGDTINWQIRYEDSNKTMVGYKENFSFDPEHVAGNAAKASGDIANAIKHYELVTDHWYRLANDSTTTPPFDTRRPGIYLTGVQTAGIISGPKADGEFPWCDFKPTVKKFWLYEGGGCDGGIPGVMGYEIDSAATIDTFYDPWRPKGQVRIAALTEAWSGTNRGSASFYRTDGGAEVVALSAMGFSWALDPYAALQSGATDTTSVCAQTMVNNALTRWSGDSPAPPPVIPDGGIDDSGVEPKPVDPDSDGGTPPIGTDAATDASVPSDGTPPVIVDGDVTPGGTDDTGVANADQPAPTATSSCGCAVPGGSTDAALGLAALGLALAVARRRR